MKKIILTLFLAIMATTGLYAQQISVVSPGGSTDLYWTLPEAINGADPGSVIYLPGGGFTINGDSVKINKKLTIIGIGHYSKSGNVDGITNISGDLYFISGSSGSAVMGCYISGKVDIGDDNSSVNNVLIRYCNVNRIVVTSANCKGTIVNQNYIRSSTNFYDSAVEITNNVVTYIWGVDGGEISNNIITWTSTPTTKALQDVNHSTVTNNIIINRSGSYSNLDGSDNALSGNMTFRSMSGEDLININQTGSTITASDVFVDYQGVSPASNFHFKDKYSQYEGQVGIYHGTFNDQQIAPVPYIVAKRVDEQTDASGKLNVKIRVKAGD